jgi:hypothetical protein
LKYGKANKDSFSCSKENSQIPQGNVESWYNCVGNVNYIMNLKYDLTLIIQVTLMIERVSHDMYLYLTGKSKPDRPTRIQTQVNGRNLN